jgi:gamma-glutamylcyclotransferase (GGCT)/AIG2-like uncharacterized protein YtfP
MPETAPEAINGERHVFVYGTLRRGDDNDITRLTPPPRFTANASIQGTMYHLGAYPGVVLGGSGIVTGEVYAISAALERTLDEIEEIYPQRRDEYFKRVVEVAVDDRLMRCIVYEINERYLGAAPVIESGDWVRGRR